MEATSEEAIVKSKVCMTDLEGVGGRVRGGSVRRKSSQARRSRTQFKCSVLVEISHGVTADIVRDQTSVSVRKYSCTM